MGDIVVENKNEYYLIVYKAIQRYEKLYRGEFKIEKVKNWVKNRTLSCNGEKMKEIIFFRLFLDGCLVLFNKEKMEKEVFESEIIGYENHFLNIEEDTRYQIFRKFYKEQFDKKLEYNNLIEFEANESIREQLRMIRNAIAHQDYCPCIDYRNYSNLIMPFFKIKNRNQERRVYELFFHDFVTCYFSNSPTKGIAYKHTGVICKERKLFRIIPLKKWYFYTVKYKGEEKYEIGKEHIMNNKAFSEDNYHNFLSFIYSHNDEFNYRIEQIAEASKIWRYLKKIGIGDIQSFGYFIKFLRDMDTEFSNFLIHISQLNDRVIDYESILSNRSKINDFDDREKFIMQSIGELKEDRESTPIFHYFFTLLKLIALVGVLELKKEESLEEFEDALSKMVIEGFRYDTNQLESFIQYEMDQNRLDQQKCDEIGPSLFVFTKIRNSLAHGKWCCNYKDKKIEYEFRDKYKDREVTINVLEPDLVGYIKSIEQKYLIE